MEISLPVAPFPLPMLSSPSPQGHTPGDRGAAVRQEGKQGSEGAAGSWAAVGDATLETAGSREVLGNTGDGEGPSHTSEVRGRLSSRIRAGAGRQADDKFGSSLGEGQSGSFSHV